MYGTPWTTHQRGGKKRERLSFEGSEEWSCSHCTYLNKANASRCGACEIQRGTSTRQAGPSRQIMHQQVDMEQLIAKDRLRQQRSKARTKQSTSPSTSLPSPALTSNSSFPYSPGSDLFDGALRLSPSTSAIRSGEDFSQAPHPLRSRSRLPETVIDTSSRAPFCALAIHRVAVGEAAGEGIQRKKNRHEKKETDDSNFVPEFKGCSSIFRISHEGVELDFEEYIVPVSTDTILEF